MLQDFSRYALALAAVNTALFLLVALWMVRHGYKAAAMLRQLFIMQWYTVQPMWLAVVFVQRAIMQARLWRQGVHVADQQKMLHAAHLDVIVFDKTGTLTSDQARTHPAAWLLVPSAHAWFWSCTRCKLLQSSSRFS